MIDVVDEKGELRVNQLCGSPSGSCRFHYFGYVALSSILVGGVIPRGRSTDFD